VYTKGILLKGVMEMKFGGIKCVFFDAADTLFRVRGGVGQVYWKVAQKYGVRGTHHEIESAFKNAFKSAPPMAFPDAKPEDIKILEKKWWYNVVKRVFSEIKIDNFDSYFEELFETFRNDAWELFPETIRVLKALKSSGFKLGIISNFDSRIYDVCSKLGIIDFFDSIVISSEVGFAKPMVGIFNIALKRNNVRPCESLHIGDSLYHDFYGARSAGIRTLLLDKEGRYRDDPNVQRIDTLEEVVDILASGRRQGGKL
jgi:putative hydrolase of the HAD superfamily